VNTGLGGGFCSGFCGGVDGEVICFGDELDGGDLEGLGVGRSHKVSRCAD
jgi:hypothetical protein